jgi:hypothetical protein
MDASSLARAVIINLDNPISTPLPCMFNPKEYSLTKSNQWNEGQVAGKDVPEFTFASGKPATLQMQLFFDTFAERIDVREVYTDRIWDLMLVDKKLIDHTTQKGRPPRVRFLWGKSWTFDAVITSIKQQFTLFLDTGMPVRAMLDITFQQIKDNKQLIPQNPTSGGDGGERVWRVQPGDTLAWIAYRMYGDATLWRPIAEQNHLRDVRDLTTGTILEIPNA